MCSEFHQPYPCVTKVALISWELTIAENLSKQLLSGEFNDQVTQSNQLFIITTLNDDLLNGKRDGKSFIKTVTSEKFL